MKRFFFLAIVIFSLYEANAFPCDQYTLCGPINVTTGQSSVYNVWDDGFYSPYSFTVIGGTVTSTSMSGNTYTVTVTWNVVGAGSVRFDQGDEYLQVNVTGSCSVPAVPNATFSYTNNCGNTVITRTGTPTSGTTWYWQTAAGGTSMVNAAVSYTATTNGVYYYLRPYASCGKWGTAQQTNTTVYVNPLPLVPATPLVSVNTCGPKILSFNGAPPSGTSWYWQGVNSAGQDYTSATATASTYSASTNGSVTYYIASRNTSGCWSSSTPVTPIVDNPPTPVPASTLFTYCEGDVMTLYPAGNIYPMLNWYNSNNQFVYSGTSVYSPTNIDNGTYTYYLKNKSGNNCESTSAAALTLQVGGPTANCDNYINWQESIVYTYNSSTDVTGTVAADSKVYSDGFGNAVQAQTKSLANNQVFASESIYDKLGNQTLTTLPAPINSSSFGYKLRFTTNASNVKYSWTDFDVPPNTNSSGEVNNPKAVNNNGPGSLGWYYSAANNLEPNIATTNYPYARSYTPAGPNPVTSKSTGPGDAYKMGSTHEAQTDKIKITSTELSHYYALRGYYNTNPYYTNITLLNYPNAATNPYQFTCYQTTSAPAQSVSNFVFTSCGAAGKPGFYPINGTISVMPGTVCAFQVTGYSTNSGSSQVLLHVTDGTGNDIQWSTGSLPNNTPGMVQTQFTVPSNVTSIKLGIQWNTPALGATVYISSVSLLGAVPSTAPVGNPGYKIIFTDPDGKRVAAFTDADGNTLATAVVTSLPGVTPVTYDNNTWSYNYYNDLGQLVATVAPKGVNIQSTSQPTTYVTTYKYDQLGRVIETTSPDEGKSRFVYSTDGKIRFSQNQEQHKSPARRFSYINYDYLGRLIESGEYTIKNAGDFAFDPSDTTALSPNSILTIVDNVGYLGVTRKQKNDASANYSDTTFIDYDVPVGFSSDGIHTLQNNLTGQVARTKNGNATTWYSYDEFGQMEWTMQNITGLGNKSVDYTYDFLGNATEVAYQKGRTEAFYHHYTYDADDKLINVTTSTDGNPYGPTAMVQAKYYYYLHGPLKRVELGNKIQGIDYVYNIDGSLKAINHPDPAQDPGLDGISGINGTFMKDAFGMALDYYANDYTPATTNIFGSLNPSGTNNQYGGLIQSQRWHSQVDNHQQNAYAYSYDNLNRLGAANFGSVSGSGGNYSFTPSAMQQYKEAVSGFDNNGNITSLSRNNKKGSSTGNSTYNYSYNSGKNQLSAITGSTTVNYQYNSIGQMIQQTEGTNTTKMFYNAYGLTKEVRDGSDNVQEQYFYDDRGDLVKKLAPLPATQGTGFKTTYYVRDATGNMLAVYEQNGSNVLALVEQPIYGAGRIGMMKPKSGTKKYFYEVDDHLGNVRAVIGAASTEAPVATFETATAAYEQSQFLRMDDARTINASIFDHTRNGSSSYSQRLNATANEKYGIARSLSVMPGDTVMLEVFAKYVDITTTDWTSAFSTLMAQIASHTTGVVIDGPNYPNSGPTFPFPTSLDKSGSSGTGPKAYLNWLIFDRNFVNTGGGYVRLSSTPKEYGQNVTHEKLSTQFTVNEPSYVYAYISNENDTPVEVYFDDFKVRQVHSPIVAGGDFYPYGLQQTERTISQEKYRFGYQGQFSEYDSLTKTNTFQLRLYDPRFGRWLSTDPYGQYESPYVGMGNNPVGAVDADGGWSWVGAGIGTAVGIGVSFAVGDQDHWYYYAAGGFAAGGIGGELAHSSDGPYDYTAHASNGWDRFTSIFGEGKASGAEGSIYHRYFPKVGAPQSSIDLLILHDPWDPNNGNWGKLDGHVFTIVNGIDYSFRPSDTRNGRPLPPILNKKLWHSDGWIGSNPAKANAARHAESLWPGYSHTELRVRTASAKVNALKSNINKAMLNPPKYRFVGGTRCASFAMKMMRRSKIVPWYSRFFQFAPRMLEFFMKNRKGVTKISP